MAIGAFIVSGRHLFMSAAADIYSSCRKMAGGSHGLAVIGAQGPVPSLEDGTVL